MRHEEVQFSRGDHHAPVLRQFAWVSWHAHAQPKVTELHR